MSQKLSDSLSKFISSNKETFDNPYSEEPTPDRLDEKKFLKEQKILRKERKKSKKKDDPIESLMGDLEKVSENFTYGDVDDFDSYLEDYLLDEEDAEFRNSLIQYGRRYARDTASNGESTEIQKAYAENEKSLEKLLREVEADKEDLGRDLKQMRANRTRNYNTLSNMVEQKNSLHNTMLSIIRASNDMKKNQFELRMKIDKARKENGEGDDTSSMKAIQGLFGIGRDALIGSYEDISGAKNEDDDNLPTSSYDEDEIISRKLFPEEDAVETDGDKFLKYEGVGAHYVLEYDDNGPVQIVTEDMDGNVIPDYPTPDINDLEFTISESTNSAVDNLSQQYTLRKI